MVCNLAKPPCFPLDVSGPLDSSERAVVKRAMHKSSRQLVEPDDLCLELVHIFLDSKILPIDKSKHVLGMFLLQCVACYHDHKLNETLINLFVNLYVVCKLT